MSSKDDIEKEFSSWRTVRPGPGTGERVLGPAFSALGIKREPFAENTPARKNGKMGFKRPSLPEAIQQSALRFLRGFAICTCVVLGLRLSVQFMGALGLMTTLSDVQQTEQQIADLARRSEFTACRGDCDRVLRLYTAALILKPEGEVWKVPNLLREKTSENVLTIRNLLEKNKEALSLIEKAAKRSFDLTKGDVPPYDHSKSTRRYGQSSSKHFQKLRHLSQLLNARALLAAQDGHEEKAWLAIEQTMKLCEYVYADRILINDMVAQSIIRNTLETVRELIRSGITIPAKTVTHLEAYSPLDQLHYSLTGESKFCSRYLRKMITFNEDVIDDANLFGLSIKSIFGRIFIWLTSPILITDIGYYQKLVKGIVTTVNEAKSPHHLWQEIKEMRYEIPFYCPLTKIAMPNYEKVIQKTLETKVKVDLTLIEVARKRGKTETFSGIHELSMDLVPVRNRVDPFSGKPYLVKSSAVDTIIYSVGPNGKDDGGRGDDIAK